MKRGIILGITALLMFVLSACQSDDQSKQAVAQAADQGPIKIAFLDPLSGAFGDVGDSGARHMAFLIDKINAEGGVLGGRKLEVVNFDSKLSPKESLIHLKSALNQDIHFIVHGNSSAISGALIDAIQKNNERNPDNKMLYFNYSAVTPSFTQDKCNFWHFRFDSHVDMKVSAITDFIAAEKKVKKVFLINQDYVFGHSVAEAAKRMLAEKAPGIKIVGESYHPIGKVKDFSSYIAKIRKSGADAIITGNWGTDMTLLGKAAKESGLKAEFYTFYAGALGIPTAMGKDVEGVKVVVEWHPNLAFEENRPFDAEFYKKYVAKNGEKKPFYYARLRTMMDMFVKAVNRAGSADPQKVANKLEGMQMQTRWGDVVMRKQDHQLLTPVYIASFAKQDNKTVIFDIEEIGYGPKTDARIEAMDTALPSSCKMQRP